MDKKRCVIVGGAGISNYEYIRPCLKDDDFYVYCDCGLRHADALGHRPDLIVGDFDSFAASELDRLFSETETIVLPCAKDDTDTVFASKAALSRGFRDFLIIGAIGGRFDHSIGNAGMLLSLHNSGAKATLIDDYSEMSIVGNEPVSIDDSWKFFSLLSIYGEAEGVTIRDARFPLDKGVIEPDYQYGISNEVLPGKAALVSVKRGKLLLVKIKADSSR